MRKFPVLLLLLALPALGDEQGSASLTYRYDVDSATTTYCRLLGAGGAPAGIAGAIQGTSRILTSGSSASVTALTAGTNPFASVGVGDVLLVTRAEAGVTDAVVVTARADADNVTVDPAVDWDNADAGRQFSWYDLQCGTAEADGWIATEGWSSKTITVQYDQGDLDALKVRYECRGGAVGALPVVVYPGESSDCGAGGSLVSGFCEYATAGITARNILVANEPHSSCRVGLAFKTTDTSDAGANLERVTVFITFTRSR